MSHKFHASKFTTIHVSKLRKSLKLCNYNTCTACNIELSQVAQTLTRPDLDFGSLTWRLFAGLQGSLLWLWPPVSCGPYGPRKGSIGKVVVFRFSRCLGLNHPGWLGVLRWACWIYGIDLYGSTWIGENYQLSSNTHGPTLGSFGSHRRSRILVYYF